MGITRRLLNFTTIDRFLQQPRIAKIPSVLLNNTIDAIISDPTDRSLCALCCIAALRQQQPNISTKTALLRARQYFEGWHTSQFINFLIATTIFQFPEDLEADPPETKEGLIDLLMAAIMNYGIELASKFVNKGYLSSEAVHLYGFLFAERVKNKMRLSSYTKEQLMKPSYFNTILSQVKKELDLSEPYSFDDVADLVKEEGQITLELLGFA